MFIFKNSISVCWACDTCSRHFSLWIKTASVAGTSLACHVGSKAKPFYGSRYIVLHSSVHSPRYVKLLFRAWLLFAVYAEVWLGSTVLRRGVPALVHSSGKHRGQLCCGGKTFAVFVQEHVVFGHFNITLFSTLEQTHCALVACDCK